MSASPTKKKKRGAAPSSSRYLIHFRPVARLVGSVRRSIKPSGNSQCQNRAENDFAIVRANARVVPLRVLNGRLTASSIDKPIVGSWLATAASSPFATRALLTWRIRSFPSRCDWLVCGPLSVAQQVSLSAALRRQTRYCENSRRQPRPTQKRMW
jgi:hypothetical protein